MPAAVLLYRLAFSFGYHACKLSDNLITPIAPLALFRYAYSLA